MIVLVEKVLATCEEGFATEIDPKETAETPRHGRRRILWRAVKVPIGGPDLASTFLTNG